VGPDIQHPFVIRDALLWNTHWAFVPGTPSVLVDGMDIYDSKYGLYHPFYEQHAYRGLMVNQTSIPEAGFTGQKPAGFSLPTPEDVEAARRRLQASNQRPANAQRKYGLSIALVNAQGETAHKLPQTDGLPYGPLSSDAFPLPLVPSDDLPPITVITSTTKEGADRLTVRGVTSDNGVVKRVVVSEREVHPLSDNFAEWEITLENVQPGTLALMAWAEDAAHNSERHPHQMTITVPK
jgi:hypothetical protein